MPFLTLRHWSPISCVTSRCLMVHSVTTWVYWHWKRGYPEKTTDHKLATNIHINFCVVQLFSDYVELANLRDFISIKLKKQSCFSLLCWYQYPLFCQVTNHSNTQRRYYWIYEKWQFLSEICIFRLWDKYQPGLGLCIMFTNSGHANK